MVNKTKSIRSIFVLFVLWQGVVNSLAQTGKLPITSSGHSSRLTSNRTTLINLAIHESGKKNPSSFLKSQYGIDPRDPDARVSGILQVTDVASLSNLFVCTKLTAIAGDIYTYEVRLRDLERLANLPDVNYISLSRKAEIQMQNSRIDAGLDKVHEGFQLKSPFTGKGVITGLIDVGIDYTQPTFRSEAGDSLRIIKAWAQGRTVGNRPANFKYGVEFVGKSELEVAQHDSIFGTHGTAVMGIMAGSGYGSAGKYRGAAPGAGIIAVSAHLRGGEEDILMDGIKYVWEEAKSQNKRAVFNLSWGSLMGPHDGTSLFDKAIDSLVGDGLIVVGAAGNWGDDSVHLLHVSEALPVVTTSLIKNYSSTSYSLIDAWGAINSNFAVQVSAIDKTTGAVTKSTDFYSTRSPGEFEPYFVFGQDTSFIYIFNINKDKLNGKPNSTIAFLHDHEKTGTYLAVNIRSTRNEVHAWAGQNGTFSNSLSTTHPLPNFQPGDSHYSIPEIGGTAKKILTAGSHVTQHKYRSIVGYDRFFSTDSGKVGPFSGQGPTADGRTKPDLTAPGSNISPANGFETSFTPMGAENFLIEEGSGFTGGGRSWYWIQEEATSFSAPMLTGSIAILLEANPTLTFEQVRDILRATATVDTFTGPIPSQGSNRWGWGKLNAYKAVSSALSMVVTSVGDEVLAKSFWYSNPTASYLSVFCGACDPNSGMHVTISDLLGKEVFVASPSSREGYFYGFHLDGLPQGQYIGRIGELGPAMKITKVD